MTKAKETIDDFLARGGKVTIGKTRKSKGYVSLSRVKAGNSAPTGSERRERAIDRATRRLA